MAIDGLIILESSGRPAIQTSFKFTSPTYALLHIEAFTHALSISDSNSLDPVLYLVTDQGPSFCCHMECGGGLRLLCTVRGDIDVLYVFSFMRLFIETLQEYLGELSSMVLRDHFDIVYQLVEEMLDNGYPLTTERCALRDIVLPPSLLSKILSATGSTSHKSNANPFASPIPWRKLGIKHTANEIFFDISEDMRATVDANGYVVSSQVWGNIETNSKLSGIPDLLLIFADNKFLQDCSFHQCVRLQRWPRDRSVSFVPPDGRFVLMDYRYVPNPVSSVGQALQIPVPFSLAPIIRIEKYGGSLDLTLTSKLTTRAIDRLNIELFLGDGATGASCTVSSGTSWSFNPKAHTLKWEILKAPQGSSHSLRGSFTTSKLRAVVAKAFQISFENSQYTFSGLRIDQLRISHESYKPFKGVRGRSCGQVEWRWK